MAAVFPGAPDLAQYWANLHSGVDSISDAPPSRIDAVYYDPEARRPDRFYCRRGGFLGRIDFDAAGFGIMPLAAASAEPDQLLVLQTAARALDDAGISDLPRARTGVLIGRGGYLTAGMARLDQQVRTAEQLVRSLRVLVPEVTEDQLEAVRAEFHSKLGLGGPDTTIGLVPNLAASRVANRLDLQGPAYTVDAACASSLVAVDQACAELALGRCDLVIAGGVHLCHDVTFWSVFSQLGALSRRQQIRPFDRGADGLLIGEGAGVVVLKRLTDALADDNRIYAVIRGTGVASDGRESSLMKPRVAGQVLALERAWAAAGLDPRSVGLIEAHGTATPAGDEAELRTLARVFGTDTEACLGSVKSMVGHTMPAAGIAGLIKAALAIYHGVQLPTLHCDEPHPLLGQTRLTALKEARPWSAAGPRRAGVNAFGFGGINAHVVLEQAASPRRTQVAVGPGARERLFLLTADSPDELIAGLDGEAVAGGRFRLALFDPTPERRVKARRIIERGRPWRGRQDIWFTGQGLITGGGTTAFVFPGIEPTFAPRVDDVAAHFVLPGAQARGATDLERHGTELIAVGRLLDAALRRIGIQPDVIAGHSIGEWSGMVASEMVPATSVDAFASSLAPGTLATVDVTFVAVGCSAERAQAAIADLAEISVSHDNCPHQAIICGRDAVVRIAVQRLRADRVLCQPLPFKSGFHSPLYAEHVNQYREVLRRLPLQKPQVPLWSATTCAPYPDAPGAIQDLVVDHLVQPVRFRQLVERLYAAGVRAFVLVGTTNLGGFIDDTLRDQPHLAIAANSPQRPGMDQLARVAAALWVEGTTVDIGQLAVECVGAPAAAAARLVTAVRLSLGAPLVDFDQPLELPEKTAITAPPGATELSPLVAGAGVDDPVMAEYAAAVAELGAAQAQILKAWTEAPERRATAAVAASAPREGTWRRELSVESDPELIDHTFYRQPRAWSSLVERFPVVPMTMLIDLMIEAGRALCPGAVAVAVENVTAYRWLAVAPPVSVEITARFDGVDRVHVRIGEYATGAVVVGPAYPPAPIFAHRALQHEESTPIDAHTLYEDGWMFHGPAYQGVVELGPTGADGIDGELVVPSGRGGLLDNAGQLLGYWVMLNTSIDRLAFPVRIGRLDLYGPEPAPGTRLRCAVRIRSLDDGLVHSDIELALAGRLWARATSWTDKRFDTDDIVWPVLRFPEHNKLSSSRSDGYYLCTEHWRGAASRELIARRYLDEAELAAFEALGVRGKRGWLLGRMAIKDAVRDWLWRRGHGAIFPVEIRVRNDGQGRPVIEGPFAGDLRVSVAHKEDVAVARVVRGSPVGIDIERVQPRGDGFAAIAFTAAERALRGGGSADEWLTRIWSAKEAFAKALGTGLEGNPRRFEVKEVAGERLLVGMSSGDRAQPPVWVETRRDGDYIVAWTCCQK
jgi:acyl transferase domain-containing protein/phosphopantetheinyl transferase (holo-ACP synthase)